MKLDLSAIRQRLVDAEPGALEPQAAVAAILRQVREPEILFIKRAEHAGDPWSGHMAFPGGRKDARDETLERTAIRETVEEIGLDLSVHGERIAQLEDVPTHKASMVVRPFVYAVSKTPDLVTNHEVAEVHWVPLSVLMSGERDTTYELAYEGNVYRFPAYRVGERVVWGLTYRFLQIVFTRLRA
jgi:8-oxo-dGTP pyrophosphatase MutT (NUDIX family)